MAQMSIINQLIGSLHQSFQTFSDTESGNAEELNRSYLKSLGCTHEAFFAKGLTPTDQCQMAISNCKDQYDFINFFQFCYCWLDGHWIGMIILSFILILLIFKFISAVVEEYLAPAITFLSEYLELSDAMGAVTLLALANGAGDVITALVASGSSDGLSYNIGAIYGAGLFVTSIVVAVTIYNSKEDIQLSANSIYRDIGMYIIATLTVITFGFIGELTVTSACILIAEYFLLVFIVYYQDRSNPKKEEDSEQEDFSPTSPPHRTDIIYLHDDKTEEEKKATSGKWQNTLSKINTVNPEKRLGLLAQNFKGAINSIVIGIRMSKRLEDKAKPFKEMSGFEKFNFIIEIPFDYVRKITLPPCEQKQYSKLYATIFPIPGLFFMYFAATQSPQLWWLIAIPIGGLMSAYIHYTSPENRIPNYYPLMELFGTIGALMWTYLVSGVLIDLLQFLGMLSKLDKTYLGLTVIAVGNALPDAVTTIALAKGGNAMMGLTGAYAGQLFGLLVGFGLALLRKTYQDGPQLFDIFNPKKFDSNLMDVIVILVALAILVITFIFGALNKYRFNKFLAQVLGGLYVTFILGATVIAVKHAMR